MSLGKPPVKPEHLVPGYCIMDYIGGSVIFPRLYSHLIPVGFQSVGIPMFWKAQKSVVCSTISCTTPENLMDPIKKIKGIHQAPFKPSCLPLSLLRYANTKVCDVELDVESHLVCFLFT